MKGIIILPGIYHITLSFYQKIYCMEFAVQEEQNLPDAIFAHYIIHWQEFHHLFVIQEHMCQFQFFE